MLSALMLRILLKNIYWSILPLEEQSSVHGTTGSQLFLKSKAQNLKCVLQEIYTSFIPPSITNTQSSTNTFSPTVLQV